MGSLKKIEYCKTKFQVLLKSTLDVKFQNDKCINLAWQKLKNLYDKNTKNGSIYNWDYLYFNLVDFYDLKLNTVLTDPNIFLYAIYYHSAYSMKIDDYSNFDKSIHLFEHEFFIDNGMTMDYDVRSYVVYYILCLKYSFTLNTEKDDKRDYLYFMDFTNRYYSYSWNTFYSYMKDVSNGYLQEPDVNYNNLHSIIHETFIQIKDRISIRSSIYYTEFFNRKFSTFNILSNIEKYTKFYLKNW